MATLKDLRLQAGLTVSKLARLADVDRQTVIRAETGTKVVDVKAYQIVKALNAKLGLALKLDDIDGLNTL